MKYAQLVNRSTQKGYNYAIAKRIKELMKDLRQRSNPHSERRWVWELLQNSKDARYPNTPLNIQIELNTSKQPRTLEFRHTGQPFMVEHITFLTEQVSSKDRALSEEGEPSSSGKFGSGFLTTHLLSEIVEIDTVVKEPDLPYVQCQLLLDRSPTDVNDIIESVNESLSALSGMDDLPPYLNYQPTDYNTTFRYKLDNKGIDVAVAGIADLHLAIPYTLLFVPYFTSIDVVHEANTYQVDPEGRSKEGKIEFHTVVKTDFFEEEKTEIAVIRGKRVQLAVPVKREKKKIYLQPVPAGVPKLFCDFPLVGTEDFPFPAVINSSLFNPNDPRSKILLTDVEENDILENKSLMEEAVGLYLQFIDACEDEKWQQTYLLGDFGAVTELDWMDEAWYEEAVVGPVRAHLLKASLVDTENHGRKAIKNEEGKNQIWFPSSTNPDILDRIDALSRQWFAYGLPRKSETRAWAKVLWKDCISVGVEALTGYIANKKNIKGLEEVLEAKTDPFGWLNDYFDLINVEGAVIKEIIANKYAVFPDQNGEFKTREDVVIDNDLPEVFKDIFKSLGKDIRAELRHSRIHTANKHQDNPKEVIKHTVRKLSTFYSELNDLLEGADADSELKAAARLACLFCKDGNFPPQRQRLFDVLNRLYPEWKLTKKMIPSYEEKIWERADKVLLFHMVMTIAGENTIGQFALDQWFSSEKEALEWLGGFVHLLVEAKEESMLNEQEYPILPDQNGEFRIKDDLMSGMFVDDDLKDISAKLGHDFRTELVNDSISLSFAANRTIADAEVIEKIKSLVANRISDMSEDPDTKEAFRLLFLWFSRYPKQGAEGFGELFTNRHRLIQPEDFEKSMEKAEKLTEIMEKNNIGDYDELDRRLQGVSNGRGDRTKLPITEEILLSMGVTSEEELIEALKDKNLQTLFSHTSIRTPEMFVFVQAKLQRAKENVLEFLSGLEEYNCSNAEMVADSVIAGITKHGREIYVVARPSDNGEVIFYYGAEKDTLEEPGAECWIEDGVSEPRMLTLGRILKVNHIMKVKVD